MTLGGETCFSIIRFNYCFLSENEEDKSQAVKEDEYNTGAVGDIGGRGGKVHFLICYMYCRWILL